MARSAIYQKIAVGYFWNLISKWLVRLVGLISSLCLVRLLQPSDFGIVALVTITLSFFVMLADVGAEKYLIKEEHCTVEMLNSAWSLSLVLKTSCGLVIFLIAPWIASFIHEPELTLLLRVASAIPILNGLKNIGLVEFERQLNFKPLTKLNVLVKLAAFPVTIGVAYVYQTYWALLIGLILSEVILVIGSYWLHPFRPAWSRLYWHEQWFFSRWHVIYKCTGYLRSRIDAFLLGRYLPASQIGLYRVGQEFAWLPFTELIAPATNSLYSGFTHLKKDEDVLHEALLNYLFLSYILVLPCAFGLFIISEAFTLTILGEQWHAAAPIIGLLAFSMLSMPLNIALQTILTNLGKLHFLVVIDAILIALIVGGIIVLSQVSGFDVFAYIEFYLVVVLAFVSILIAAYKWILNLSLTRVLSSIVIPLLPTLLMSLVVAQVEVSLNQSAAITFVLCVVSGVVIYVPILGLLVVSLRRFVPECDFVCRQFLRLRSKSGWKFETEMALELRQRIETKSGK